MKRPRRRTGRLVLRVAVCAAAGGAGLWLAWTTVCEREPVGLCGLDAIERIEVRGAVRLDPAQVKAWAGVRLGMPLWAVDGDAIAARLDGRPWIQSVTVTKRFPDALVIHVRERVPVAVAATARGRVLVDAEGTVIGPTTIDRGFPLILAGSVSRREALAVAVRIVEAFRAADVSVVPLDAVVIDVTDPDDPVVRLSAAMHVRLGRGGYAEKWRRMQAIADNAAEHIPGPRLLDLRFADRAVVTARDGVL